MFTHARLKLTAWYILITAIIALSFSLVVYRFISLEINRYGQAQQLRFQRRIFEQFGSLPPPMQFDPELLAEAKHRMFLNILSIDIFILAASAAAGFFLAGRTLQPIADMVEDQNRFISDSSHELRTPLTSLKSEIEVNLRDKQLTLVSAKRLLASNLEEVNNLQSLSDNLIRLAQFRQTGNSLPIENISLSDLVSESIKKVSGLAKAKNITLTTNILDGILQGNKVSLIDMLVIFLDNAIKYSPKNSIVKIDGQFVNRHVIIKIADQGVGIESADLPHIFDRFFRGLRSRSKLDTDGFGLGLSIAKQIIDRHHGSVKVTSSANSGTTFTIKI